MNATLLLFDRYHRFISFFFFSSRRRHTKWVSDWSSDVCSSDLSYPLELVQEGNYESGAGGPQWVAERDRTAIDVYTVHIGFQLPLPRKHHRRKQIGRASCRERV